MKAEETKGHRTEVTFARGEKSLASLTVEGIDLSKDPEKVKKLMELLDLPQGTNARVTLTASSVIVR